MEVALFEPRIPQNTGNIARSCAAFNIPLNLIEPLGFKLEDKYLKRAGLDYWPLVTVNKYENFENFLTSKSTKRIISFSKKNGLYLKDFKFKKDDILLLGRESKGVPKELHSSLKYKLKIPISKNTRSLNVAISGAVASAEALRQNNFL